MVRVRDRSSKKKPNKTCKQCGSEFYTSDKRDVYCGSKCYGLATRGPRKDRKCIFCGESILAANWSQKVGACKECVAFFKKTQEVLKKLRTRGRCKGCGEFFWSTDKRKKFCGKGCQVAHAKKPNATCNSCGKAIRRFEGALQKFHVHYCSVSCQAKGRARRRRRTLPVIQCNHFIHQLRSDSQQLTTGCRKSIRLLRKRTCLKTGSCTKRVWLRVIKQRIRTNKQRTSQATGHAANGLGIEGALRTATSRSSRDQDWIYKINNKLGNHRRRRKRREQRKHGNCIGSVRDDQS